MEEFQNLKIMPNGRILLDNQEIRNVKEFELKSSAEGPAELTIKLDVEVRSVGAEPEYVRLPYARRYARRQQLHTDPQQPKVSGQHADQHDGGEDSLQECPCPMNSENSDL